MNHKTASSPESISTASVTQALLEFRDQRNWAQFHTLRNLIVSLNLEASELLELTQWKTEEEMTALVSDATMHEALCEECGDILLYLLLIAERAGFDLLDAAVRKMQKNAAKYPVSRSYGSSRKYTEFTND